MFGLPLRSMTGIRSVVSELYHVIASEAKNPGTQKLIASE